MCLSLHCCSQPCNSKCLNLAGRQKLRARDSNNIMAMDRSLKSSYHLIEDKQITDEHMDTISRTLCRKWRFLLVHLKLGSYVKEDIDRMQLGEDEKRSKFFETWKEKKGSGVTYKELISALQKIECTQDAESVFELLISVHQQHSEASLNITGIQHSNNNVPAWS